MKKQLGFYFFNKILCWTVPALVLFTLNFSVAQNLIYPNPANWDTIRIYSQASGTFQKIAIGDRLKGINDDTFRIATGQSPLNRNAIILTDTSSAPPMKWRADIPFTGDGTNGILSVAIGNVDGDGINEVIFGQAGGNLKRVKWISNSWNVTQIDSQGGQVYDIAIGDADNNGIQDIIFARYNYVFRSYWTGSSWQTNQIWSGDGSICQGVAISDFDTAFAGNEIVAVTYSGKAIRIRWNGSSWDTLTMYYNSTCSFYDPVIGDFDSLNPGNEIVFGNGTATPTQGSVIELFGAGTNWSTTKIFTPSLGEAHQNLTIGDVLDEHLGLEVISIGISSQAYVRVIYGSGSNWSSQLIISFPQTPANGIAIGNINKYRSYNQEIVFARNTILYEAEQRIPPGPTITNVYHSPKIPLSSENVTVRAKILDTLTITADSLYYAINSPNNWQSISHFNLDSFYYYTIPTQDTGTIIYYFIIAKNNGGGRSQSLIFSYQVAYEHSIYQIQYTSNPSDTSLDNNKYVFTKGIVTGVFGRFFNIEEEPGGAWHGIHIRRPAFSDTAPNLAIGDSVEVLGRVQELAKQTVINVFYDSGGRVQRIEPTRPLPCTTITPINQIAESLEGSLIRVDTLRFKTSGIFQPNTVYWASNFAETESIPVFIRSETNIPNESIPVGFFLLTGCLNQYINLYQIMPRLFQDFNLLPVDLGPTEILTPPDTVNYGDSIFPKVIIRNYQMTPVANLSVWLRIGNTYTDERFFPKLSFQPYDTIEFNLWLGNPGWHGIKTWTKLRNDLNPNNDTLLDSVYVRPPALPPDIGVTKIIPMNDTVSIGDTFMPKVTIKNFSPTPAINFFVHFKIGDVFSDSVFILNLSPYQIDTIQFQPWIAQPGIYQLTAYTNLILDPNPSNDTAYGSLMVRNITGGWQERSSMPIGSGKRVKQGGALVYTHHDTIYALKGNNTLEFYAYNTTTDSWVKKESLPMLATKPKRVKKGAALTYDRWNNKIYALKGNNTREFWQYDLLKDSWIYLDDVPSANGKGIKGGAALTCAKIGQNIYIYFMKGTKTSEFCAYDATADTWIKNLKLIPILPSGKPMKDGSSMVKGDSVLFCLKGGYNDFYAYSIGSDTWYLKKSLPMIGTSQRKKKAKDGAGLCYDDAHNVVYCLKGGNTQEFWAYYPDLDTWIELETIPKGPSNKRVKGGGALTFAEGLIFALKGNNTRELWCYTPKTIKLQNPILLTVQCLNRNVMSEGIALKKEGDKIKVLFGSNITLTGYSLYNVLGRLVRSEQNKKGNNNLLIDMKGIPSGVYILKLNSNKTTITQKIILNH